MRAALWVLCTWLTLGPGGHVATELCPRECTCAQGLHLEYECALGNGSLQLLLQPQQFLRVTCTDLTTLPTQLPALLHLNGSALPSVSFTGCPPPADGGWIDFLHSLGISGIRSLKLSTLPAHTVPLSRHHLHRLLELDSLWLEDALPGVLPPDLLADLPALRRLTVRGSVARLEPDTFASLPHLELLEIAETNVTEVPAHAFRGLARLRRLGLWRSGVARLDEAALVGLDALQDLDLGSNELRSLPPRVLTATKQLRRLTLNGNPLEELQTGSLAGLVHLREVAVWDTRASLLVGGRLLAALPALDSVRLERCALRSVPGDLLAGSAALRSLTLAGNKLRALPATLLRDQPHLLHLDLSGNELATLDPLLFAHLGRLLTLDVDRNKIKELPARTFSGLSAVQNVSLQRNGLQAIAEGAFSGANNLSRLVLAHNNLSLSGGEEERRRQQAARAADDSYVGFGALSPLAELLHLRHLDLSHNRVADVFADWRLHLLDLRHLDLSHNAFQALTESDLNFLGEITVDFRHNNITTILLPAASLVRSLTADAGESAAHVLLAGNPFHCDCRIYQLLQRLGGAAGGAPRSEPALDAEGSQCASPPALAGHSLVTVPRGELTCRVPPGEGCPARCACTQRPGADIMELACEAPPPPGAWPPPARWGLGASSLRLTAPPPATSLDVLHLPPHVAALHLAGLGLRELAGAAPPRLHLLDLADNHLRALPAHLLARNNRTRLRLSGNPFLCDCDHREDVILLQQWKSQVSDWETVECTGDAGVVRVESVSAETLCAARHQVLAMLVLGVSAALLAALGAALCRRYEQEARVWLAARGLLCCRAADPDDVADRHKRYDAFVSYSHLDEEWVLSELVPRLEPGLRLCVHFRDWVAGEFIPAQIARSVAESRRTIVVLSDNFVRSVWGRLEWRAAHVHALREGRARLVVLVLGELDPARLEPELRAYLNTNTYVKVGDPWFWDKLQYALPRRVRIQDEADRSVARKKGFDDRLPPPPPPPPAVKHPAALALQVQLTPEGQLVNSPGKHS